MSAETAKTNESKTISHSNRRKRRHWYDHEKLEIIQKYDAGELPAVRGKPTFRSDPKSGEELSIFAIETWKDQFRTFGVLGKQKSIPKIQEMQPAKTAPKESPQASANTVATDVKDLLVQTLLENQKLKAELAELRKSNSKFQRPASRSSEISL